MIRQRCIELDYPPSKSETFENLSFLTANEIIYTVEKHLDISFKCNAGNRTISCMCLVIKMKQCRECQRNGIINGKWYFIRCLKRTELHCKEEKERRRLTGLVFSKLSKRSKCRLYR